MSTVSSFISRRLSTRSTTRSVVEKPLAAVTRYRTEGDKFRHNRSYAKAYAQYANALKYAPDDATLWTDLASCSFKLNKYDDTVEHARKAVEVDNLNAKAWGLLAKCYAKMEQWITCFEAYDNALAILKRQDPPDHKLREELQLSYSEAKEKAQMRRSAGSRQLVSSRLSGDQPWERAVKFVEEYKASEGAEPTSALVILEAHEEFKKGYDFLNDLKDVELADGNMGVSGSSQAITYMTNGIVRDDRCFYMQSQQKFMQLLSSQAQFEILRSDAWDLSAKEELVIREAKARQQYKGWDDVRPALSATIRIWILNAHISQGIGQYGQAVGLYKRALAVLDWGRKEWGKASRKERGTIFDSTFVRGVRVLYGHTLIRAHEQTANEKNPPYPLRDIIVLSDRIMDDCRDRPVRKTLASGKPASAVFIMSSQSYPEGKARMYRGYYYYQLGKGKIIAGESRAEANRDLRMSANEYMNACNFFPLDDEYHSICTMHALEALFMAKTTLKETSAIITDLRASWAASTPIWGQGSFATSGGREKIARLFQFQDNALRAVEDKAGALGDRIVPGRLGDRIL